MAVTKSKPRQGVKVPTTKMCTCCHQIRNLSDFYSNRDWTEQLGKDVWCKACAGKAKTKDELRKYFWENNREWSDKQWENGAKKAQQELSRNAIFQKTTDERRQALLDMQTCKNVLKSMQVNYKFVDNSKNVFVNSYEDAKEAGHVVETNPKEGKQDPNVKTYSAEFNGDFKPQELDYLEKYYRGLDHDFALSDISLQDNAKKLAKASLLVDKVQNDYMLGRCDFSVVKDAVAQYDLLMKTGNFAACKRKPEEKNEETSFSEITKYCETHGHPCVKKIEWPKDVVDQTLEALRYIAIAIQGDEAGEVS